MAKTSRIALTDDGHLTREKNQHCKGSDKAEIVCWVCEESLCLACGWFEEKKFRTDHAECKPIDSYGGEGCDSPYAYWD